MVLKLSIFFSRIRRFSGRFLSEFRDFKIILCLRKTLKNWEMIFPKDNWCRLFLKTHLSGCIRVNRDDICRCARVGWCGSECGGGWVWGASAGPVGRKFQKIPDPVFDPVPRSWARFRGGDVTRNCDLFEGKWSHITCFSFELKNYLFLHKMQAI